MKQKTIENMIEQKQNLNDDRMTALNIVNAFDEFIARHKNAIVERDDFEDLAFYESYMAGLVDKVEDILKLRKTLRVETSCCEEAMIRTERLLHDERQTILLCLSCGQTRTIASRVLTATELLEIKEERDLMRRLDEYELCEGCYAPQDCVAPCEAVIAGGAQ